jgi:hypothetical protein
MPLMSLRRAAAEARVSKSTIQRAINAGRLSAGRTDGGGYAIDPAELFRVYPPDRPVARPAGQDAPASDPQVGALVSELRAQLARMDRVLDDVREEKDRWRSMAERLALAAPSQIVMPAPTLADPGSPLTRAWRWMRKAG